MFNSFWTKKCFLAVMRRPDYAIRQFGVESIFQLSAVLSCLSFEYLVGHLFCPYFFSKKYKWYDVTAYMKSTQKSLQQRQFNLIYPHQSSVLIFHLKLKMHKFIEENVYWKNYGQQKCWRKQRILCILFILIFTFYSYQI